jgi:pullulanase/glycogen debranching enzyme
VPDRQGRLRGADQPRRGRRLRLARVLAHRDPGQRYGFRVHGPWDPAAGHRCDPSKLLLDPYGKSFHGDFEFTQALFSYDLEAAKVDPTDTGTPGIDSLGHTMTSVVINPYFDWASDRAPRTPYHETVIYEAHVKGMTQTHPAIPEEARGTYAGLSHRAVIDHLKSLNVTAIELMPVHQFMHDHRLIDLGLRNYWGYNTFGFLAPHYQYSSSRHAAVPVPSSRRWCGPSTRQASRSSSTWSTTTRRKATTSGRRSTSAASTMPPTTGCSTVI